MNALQQAKYINVTPPAAIIDNASAATTAIDTLGYSHVAIIVSLGATDIALTALKLQESDTDGSYADVTGAIFGTSADPTGTATTLPAATDDNKLYAIFVNMSGRKRWLDLACTFGDGAAGGYVSVLAILTCGDEQPLNAAGMNLAQYLVV